jgi:hypothetical protein
MIKRFQRSKYLKISELQSFKISKFQSFNVPSFQIPRLLYVTFFKFGKVFVLIYRFDILKKKKRCSLEALDKMEGFEGQF